MYSCISGSREDLDQFPNNGWFLHGLANALNEQGKTVEAEKVEAELAQVCDNEEATLSLFIDRN